MQPRAGYIVGRLRSRHTTDESSEAGWEVARATIPERRGRTKDMAPDLRREGLPTSGDESPGLPMELLGLARFRCEFATSGGEWRPPIRAGGSKEPSGEGSGSS